MTLPSAQKVTMEVKWYLSSFRASQDVRWAIKDVEKIAPAFLVWRVQWGGICAVLKTSIHLMRMDAKRCFSPAIRQAMAEAWTALGRDKAAYPLFWEFINRERNNILKEYEFSAYDGLLREDGTIEVSRSLLSSFDAERKLYIKGGPYDGRLALELASEAVDWVQDYLKQAIRNGGFDPDERVTSDGFLYTRRTGLAGEL